MSLTTIIFHNFRIEIYRHMRHIQVFLLETTTYAKDKINKLKHFNIKNNKIITFAFTNINNKYELLTFYCVSHMFLTSLTNESRWETKIITIKRCHKYYNLQELVMLDKSFLALSLSFVLPSSVNNLLISIVFGSACFYVDCMTLLIVVLVL